MKTLKLGMLAALLALGATHARADLTNLVENMHIHLFALRQGEAITNRNLIVTPAVTVRLNTRQVIEALGAATANSFSSTSRLVFVTSLNGAPPAIEVRDGDVKVNVTAFFALEQVGSSVTSSSVNTRNGRSTQIIYSIQRFLLQDAEGYPALDTHFSVNGFSSDLTTDPVRRGPASSFYVDVAGTGDRNGEPLVIQGSIRFSGQTIEVEPEDDNPPTV